MASGWQNKELDGLRMGGEGLVGLRREGVELVSFRMAEQGLDGLRMAGVGFVGLMMAEQRAGWAQDDKIRSLMDSE